MSDNFLGPVRSRKSTDESQSLFSFYLQYKKEARSKMVK